MQCAGNVLQSCTPEIYMVLLANITSINSIAIISSLSYCTDEIKVRPRNNLSVSCRVPGIWILIVDYDLMLQPWDKLVSWRHSVFCSKLRIWRGKNPLGGIYYGGRVFFPGPVLNSVLNLAFLLQQPLSWDTGAQVRQLWWILNIIINFIVLTFYSVFSWLPITFNEKLYPLDPSYKILMSYSKDTPVISVPNSIFALGKSLM